MRCLLTCPPLGGLWTSLSVVQNPVTNAAPPGTTSAVGTNAPSLDKIDAEARDLRAGDVLRFSVDQDLATAKLFQLVDVTAAGEALFPVTKESDLYVTLNVRGRKLTDLRKDVKALLDADYYHECTVKIDLEQIRSDPSIASPENSSKVAVFGVTSGMVSTTRARVEQQIFSYERSLEQKQQDLDDFRRKQNITSVQDAGVAAEARLDRTQAEYANLQAELELYENAKAETLATRGLGTQANKVNRPGGRSSGEDSEDDTISPGAIGNSRYNEIRKASGTSKTKWSTRGSTLRKSIPILSASARPSPGCGTN